MEISVETIKALREQTGAGVMDCKNSLELSGGDIAKAEALLREKGIASAAKKAARDTHDGLIESYIHSGARIGALVEVNCETDFVARTGDLKQLAHDIAMQVAAMDPSYIDSSDAPTDDKSVSETCLLQQPFIKDPARTIQDLINETIGKVGENVRVGRFTRFSLGE